MIHDSNICLILWTWFIRHTIQAHAFPEDFPKKPRTQAERCPPSAWGALQNTGVRPHRTTLTLEGLSGSFHQLLYGVTGQVSSSVLGFAVRASIQTSKGQEERQRTCYNTKHSPQGTIPNLLLHTPHVDVFSWRWSKLLCHDYHSLENRVPQGFLRQHRILGRVLLLQKFSFSSLCRWVAMAAPTVASFVN